MTYMASRDLNAQTASDTVVKLVLNRHVVHVRDSGIAHRRTGDVRDSLVNLRMVDVEVGFRRLVKVEAYLRTYLKVGL